MSNIIKVPKFPNIFQIDQNWFDKRDKITCESGQIQTINDENFNDAEFVLKKITATSNSAEKLRKEFGKPFQDLTKKIKKMADEARKPLEDEKARLKNIMADYIKEIEAKKEEDFFNNIMSEEPAKPIPSIQEPNRIMTTVRKDWDFEIINPELIPRRFCSPDTKKIREYLKAEKDGANIPGVRFFEETKVQSR